MTVEDQGLRVEGSALRVEDLRFRTGVYVLGLRVFMVPCTFWY